MRGVEPLSLRFASKHSYSIGFKDYPCLLGLTRLTLPTSTTLFLKYTENLQKKWKIVHLSVPKQVLLGFSGSSLISRSLISRSHIDNSSNYCLVVYPTVLLCSLSPRSSKPKHPQFKRVLS